MKRRIPATVIMHRAGARTLAVSLVVMVATVVAGLAFRFAHFFLHLELPPFAVKYGGSTMWALMIYWIVSTLLPSWRAGACFLLAGTIATGVEFAKLYHSPALDAFRLTLPGMLLLGRFFSVRDIVAYWLAIAAGAAVDRHFLRASKQA